MTEHFITQDGEPVPVIVRAATRNYEQPPPWQHRAHYAMSEDGQRALQHAVAGRIKPRAIEALLAELRALPQITGHGDAIVHRDFGHHGSLEVTIVEAAGPLASRYLAVSRLPEGERDVYIDALLDDALAEREAVPPVRILADPGASGAATPAPRERRRAGARTRDVDQRPGHCDRRGLEHRRRVPGQRAQPA